MNRRQLLMDREHGSLHLLHSLLNLIQNDPQSRSSEKKFLKEMASTFGDMELITDAVQKLQSAENLQLIAQNLERSLFRDLDQLVLKTKACLKGTKICTYSHSSTVSYILNKIDTDVVYCLESLPGGEGKNMADEIGGELISDRDYSNITSKLDYLVFGCDSYNDQIFVNKIGTGSIIKQTPSQVEVIVLAQSTKYRSEIVKVDHPLLEMVSRNRVDLITPD